jgi:hypothetical protein
MIGPRYMSSIDPERSRGDQVAGIPGITSGGEDPHPYDMEIKRG